MGTEHRGLGSGPHQSDSVCLSCKGVTAMGKTWHPEHFVCTHCQEEIGSRNFFERDGQPYCERDYHSLFSPRCCYCNGPILDVRLLGPVCSFRLLGLAVLSLSRVSQAYPGRKW